MQTAVDTDQSLASPSTLCRFENMAHRKAAVDLNNLLADQFIASHAVTPKEIILDIDATDDAVHGDHDQEGRFFHSYYDHLRLMLSSLAYELFDYIQHTALKNTRPSSTLRILRVLVVKTNSRLNLVIDIVRDFFTDLINNSRGKIERFDVAFKFST